MEVNKNPGTTLAANAERQLAGDYINPATGAPYDNTADLSATNEPGYFVIPDVWNVNGGDGGGVGNFPNDNTVPNRVVAFSPPPPEVPSGCYRVSKEAR